VVGVLMKRWIGVAPPEREARHLFAQGEAAYRAGQYEAAATAWNRAYELSGRGVILYNVAQAYDRLGRFAEERQALEQFLAQTTGPEAQRAEAARRVEELEARALFDEGQAAYHEGRYEAALEAWTRAYELSGRGEILYNVAQAYGRLGRFLEEKHALERFLAEPTGPESYRTGAAARIEALDARVARTAIVIDAELDGAEVFVDGEPVGRLPLDGPLHVEPGRHDVTAQHEGYVDASTSVSVDPGEVETVSLRFEEVLVVGERRASPLVWTLWSTGGGLVIAGAVVGGLAFGEGRGAERGSSAARRSRKMAIATDVSISVGAAAAAAGLIVHLIERRRRGEDAEDQAPALALAPGRDGALLVLSGGF
jgi:hypothetical protein